MIETEISNVLAQIRAHAASMDRPVAAPRQPAGTGETQSAFGTLVKQAVNQVNEQQAMADSLIQKFQVGDPDTSIAEVVVQMQKASISFQAMSEARNRIVEAYREIMSMSI